MAQPTTPAEQIQAAAQRHQAARDAADQAAKLVAEDRAKQATGVNAGGPAAGSGS